MHVLRAATPSFGRPEKIRVEPSMRCATAKFGVVANARSASARTNAEAHSWLAYALRRRGIMKAVAEVNNGGDMVGATLRMVDPNVAFTAVRASRGKVVRAEPAAALYQQGRVHHIGTFPQLEDQMTNFTLGYRPRRGGVFAGPR